MCVTFSSFISPSSCTINSLLLSCRDDILCSSSSFLCLKDTQPLCQRGRQERSGRRASSFTTRPASLDHVRRTRESSATALPARATRAKMCLSTHACTDKSSIYPNMNSLNQTETCWINTPAPEHKCNQAVMWKLECGNEINSNGKPACTLQMRKCIKKQCKSVYTLLIPVCSLTGTLMQLIRCIKTMR